MPSPPLPCPARGERNHHRQNRALLLFGSHDRNFAVFMLYPVFHSLVLGFFSFDAGEYAFVGWATSSPCWATPFSGRRWATPSSIF